MGYIEQNLNENEIVIYKANVSWAVFFRPIIILVLLIWLSSKVHEIVVVLVVILGLLVFLRIFIAIVTTEFALTNRRIIAKRGFLNRETMEILLEKVESINISQPLDGRIFGFGTVTVVGSGGSKNVFPSISHPFELQKQVNHQISKG